MYIWSLVFQYFLVNLIISLFSPYLHVCVCGFHSNLNFVSLSVPTEFIKSISRLKKGQFSCSSVWWFSFWAQMSNQHLQSGCALVSFLCMPIKQAGLVWSPLPSLVYYDKYVRLLLFKHTSSLGICYLRCYPFMWLREKGGRIAQFQLSGVFPCIFNSIFYLVWVVFFMSLKMNIINC